MTRERFHGLTCASRAFTLVELLVVIAIIVVLLAILVPALDKALDSGQRAVCGSHENAIWKAAKNFSFNNKGKVHRFRSSLYKWFDDGRGSDGQVADTAGQQSAGGDTRKHISSKDSRAYWGVLYTEGWGADRKMYNCPAAERCDMNMVRTNTSKGVDQDGDWGDAPANSSEEVAWSAGGQWTNYGFNGSGNVYFSGKVYNNATGFSEDEYARIGTDSADGSYYDDEDTYGRRPARTWNQIKNPGRTIFFHDSMETMLEGGSDTLADINEWNDAQNSYPDDPEGWREWFRHSNGSMVIWGDGHAEYIQATKDLETTRYPFGPERVSEIHGWYNGNSQYQGTQNPGSALPDSPI